MRMFTRLACRSADWFAHPAAIIAVPVLCTAWMWSGYHDTMLTLILSVLAISTTQLVLIAQGRSERRMHEMLKELVRAVPEADEKVLDAADV